MYVFLLITRKQKLRKYYSLNRVRTQKNFLNSGGATVVRMVTKQKS